jgi:hypothetical protein
VLDNIACSAGLHKHVQNCRVLVLNGLESDHHAVHADIVITFNKFKEITSVNAGMIDWHKIMSNKTFQQLYNTNALALTGPNIDYNDFNMAILDAAKTTATAMTIF